MKMHTKLTAFALLLILWGGPAASAEPGHRDRRPDDGTAVIVIDPGHGGADEGVKGPDGTLEKTLMLELARKIEARLVPDYEVRLTRDDDYQVSLTDRTGVANTIQAAVMISLHAGAGFAPRADTTAIYTYRRPLSKPLPPAANGEGPLTEWQWRHQQARHQQESERLGNLIAARLSDLPSDKAVSMESGRLPVLAGADMPAVLLEFGDLNGPAGEKRLSATDWQQQSAGAIAAAVREFLATNPQ